MPTALDPRQLQQLRRQLLKKGAELNEKLVQLLGGSPVDVNRLPGISRPGEQPSERLRRFLDLVDRKIQAIRSGSYGRCDRCGAALSFVELEQMPWADLCRRCSEPSDDPPR
jgi:RNA polymerase-binding transcription factor DksA